jgi:hypothetical protein
MSDPPSEAVSGAQPYSEQRVIRRVQRIMAALAVAGTVIGGIYWGVPAAAGFAAGSVIAFFNFRWLSRMVLSIGAPDTAPEKRLKPVSAMLLAARYLLFGAAGYAIFIVSETGFKAALAGCCINIAAVILEVFYELIYAGTP